MLEAIEELAKRIDALWDKLNEIRKKIERIRSGEFSTRQSRNELDRLHDDLMNSMRRIREINPTLRITESYQEMMGQVINGSGYQGVLQSLDDCDSEVRKGTETLCEEETEVNSEINSCNAQKDTLVAEAAAAAASEYNVGGGGFTCGGGGNGAFGSGGGGGRGSNESFGCGGNGAFGGGGGGGRG